MTNYNDGYSDAMERWKIIESEKRMTQAMERLKTIRMWSFQDAREFIMAGVWQEEKAEGFLLMIAEAEDKANKEIGPPTPYLAIKNLEMRLRLAVMTSFHVVDHAGGITGLGSMVFVPNGGHRSWRIYNPTILTANYQERGNFGRIGGPPGKGKTNLGCKIAEQYASEENHVSIGNIRMLNPDPRFIYTKDAKALFLAIANLPYETSWLFTHDEGGLSYSKPDQTTRRVKDLDKLMRCVRKLGGSYNLIEQREDCVPNLIVEFAKNIFYCEEKGIVSIEMRGPSLAFRDTVEGFPKTTLPFDTDDIAMFDINIDVQEVFSAISGSDDPKKALREFLNMEEQPRKEYLARVCAYPGCGKSLVGMSNAAKYCSNNVPPWHAQLDYHRKRQYLRETDPNFISREERQKIKVEQDKEKEKEEPAKSFDEFVK